MKASIALLQCGQGFDFKWSTTQSPNLQDVLFFLFQQHLVPSSVSGIVVGGGGCGKGTWRCRSSPPPPETKTMETKAKSSSSSCSSSTSTSPPLTGSRRKNFSSDDSTDPGAMSVFLGTAPLKKQAKHHSHNHHQQQQHQGLVSRKRPASESSQQQQQPNIRKRRVELEDRIFSSSTSSTAIKKHREIICQFLRSADVRRFSDVSILCKDGKLPAHKLVLSAVSPNFLKPILESMDDPWGEATLICPDVQVRV